MSESAFGVEHGEIAKFDMPGTIISGAKRMGSLKPLTAMKANAPAVKGAMKTAPSMAANKIKNNPVKAAVGGAAVTGAGAYGMGKKRSM